MATGKGPCSVPQRPSPSASTLSLLLLRSQSLAMQGGCSRTSGQGHRDPRQVSGVTWVSAEKADVAPGRARAPHFWDGSCRCRAPGTARIFGHASFSCSSWCLSPSAPPAVISMTHKPNILALNFTHQNKDEKNFRRCSCAAGRLPLNMRLPLPFCLPGLAPAARLCSWRWGRLRLPSRGGGVGCRLRKNRKVPGP